MRGLIVVASFARLPKIAKAVEHVHVIKHDMDERDTSLVQNHFIDSDPHMELIWTIDHNLNNFYRYPNFSLEQMELFP